MKLWLFDILACPIDKFFPLKLIIFSYENKMEDFKQFLDIYENRKIEKIQEENIIEFSKKNNEYLIKDNISIENKSASKYFEFILSSINELSHVLDKSSNDLARKSFEIILKKIKQKILKFLESKNFAQIKEILPELYLLNKIKIEVEIESGLLYCEQCKRWFPIIETIPQMLPDEYREKEKDINFLKTNRNLLDDKFLNQDLKPFNI